MKKYHKINSIFKRDEKTHKFTSEYSTEEFEYLKNSIWSFTEKVDGTNIRIYWNGKNKTLGGRTDKAIIPPNLIEKLNEMFPDELLKSVFNPNSEETDVMLYGEGYGNKIQKVGRLYLPDNVSFILFDIQIGYWWLKREDVDKLASELNIKSVPVIGEGTLEDAINMVKNNLRSKLGDLESEGLIAVPKTNLLSRNGQRIITKIKGCDFKE